jgi:hypothetical protein
MNQKIDIAVCNKKFDEDGGLLVEGYEFEEKLMDDLVT